MRDAANRLHNPLVATLRATIQQGQQLADQAAKGPAQAGQPDQQRQQFDALAARFKQIAACLGSLEPGSHPARPEQLQFCGVATVGGS